ETDQRMAAEQGNEAVHACLAKVAPEGAERLHPNNLKRVIRALEVYEQTGMTIDAFNRLHKRPAPKYAALKIGVCPAERQTLYDRIDRRVDQMLADGLLEETKRLLDSGALAGTAAQAIGYKELLGYLQGDAPLADCVALLKQRSRNYAKRQLTWLKRDDNIHWIYYNNGEELPAILQEATEYLQKHGVQ
ncbi:MAG: tRNA (adenosine(37)-N6)-dimethylallyltransferase MiaA, partial [Agathobaculum sp.]